MVSGEQHNGAVADRSMSMVMWDMLTGSAPYRDIFVRTLHPAFWLRFLRELVVSLADPQGGTTDRSSQVAPSETQDSVTHGVEMMKTGELGKVYQDGEVIIRRGEIGDCMFVIQEGQVEIILEQNGQDPRPIIRGPGEFFGEMAIFEREVRMATVRALGQARILTVDKKNFIRRMHQDPSVAYRLVQTMSHRIRELSAETTRTRGA
jgi:hypothetical protein